MGVMDKLKKNSRVSETATLADSQFFSQNDQIPTDVPMVNVALSGRIDGGISAGLTVLAGPSKHFKTSFALLMASAYLNKYDDAVLLFYDSEFGSPQGYFESFGIDPSRVLHTPITDVEQIKFDMMNQLDNIERDDHVVVVIDSVGNLASKKEVEDAMNEKSVADMSRAKALKGLFRMVTPHLTMKNIPLLAVNHTYNTMEMYSKAVVSGGCVVKDTMIQTPDGVKAVQDFSTGDAVTTMQGNQPVTHSWDPDTLDEGEPECYEIEFEDGYKVTCSANHRFLINNEWVKAQDIVEGMDCSTID